MFRCSACLLLKYYFLFLIPLRVHVSKRLHVSRSGVKGSQKEISSIIDENRDPKRRRFFSSWRSPRKKSLQRTGHLDDASRKQKPMRVDRTKDVVVENCECIIYYRLMHRFVSLRGIGLWRWISAASAQNAFRHFCLALHSIFVPTERKQGKKMKCRRKTRDDHLHISLRFLRSIAAHARSPHSTSRIFDGRCSSW